MNTYQLVILLKTLNEIAIFAMLGMGLLYLFAGNRREQNPIYLVFKIVASPALKLARLLAPRFVLDRHIGALAFFMLMVFEFALILAKLNLIAQAGQIASP